MRPRFWHQLALTVTTLVLFSALAAVFFWLAIAGGEAATGAAGQPLVGPGPLDITPSVPPGLTDLPPLPPSPPAITVQVPTPPPGATVAPPTVTVEAPTPSPGATVVPLPVARYLPLVTHRPAPCSLPPGLLDPIDGKTVATLIPVLSWSGTTQISGTIVSYASDAAFSRPVTGTVGPLGGGGRSYQVAANLAPGGTYYWRVQEQCGAAFGPVSQVATFIVGSDGIVLPAAVLSAPISGTVVSAAGPTLAWQPVAGALDYQVWLRRVGFDAGVPLPAPEASFTAGGLKPKSLYEWWVVARNAYAYGAASARRRFSTP